MGLVPGLEHLHCSQSCFAHTHTHLFVVVSVPRRQKFLSRFLVTFPGYRGDETLLIYLLGKNICLCTGRTRKSSRGRVSVVLICGVCVCVCVSFHLQLYNVDQLMACVLPYYDTNIFVRVLQLLKISAPTNRWNWLQCLQVWPLTSDPSLSRVYADVYFLSVCVETRCPPVQDHPGHSLLLWPELHGLHLLHGDQEYPGNLEGRERKLKMWSCCYVFVSSTLTSFVSLLCVSAVSSSPCPAGLLWTLGELLPAQSHLLLLCLHYRLCSGGRGQSVWVCRLQTAAVCPEGQYFTMCPHVSEWSPAEDSCLRLSSCPSRVWSPRWWTTKLPPTWSCVSWRWRWWWRRGWWTVWPSTSAGLCSRSLSWPRRVWALWWSYCRTRQRALLDTSEFHRGSWTCWDLTSVHVHSPHRFCRNPGSLAVVLSSVWCFSSGSRSDSDS